MPGGLSTRSSRKRREYAIRISLRADVDPDFDIRLDQPYTSLYFAM
jgi:hypothetical protein